MPVTPTYPGVYIEEIPSGVRTITGVATSITAFVGRTLRGPTDEPITINSFGDFEGIFGGLWLESPLSYAVRDFYLNGGNQAIIVRLFEPEAGADIISNTPVTIEEFKFEAAYPGSWGENLRAAIDMNVATNPNLDPNKAFNLTIRDLSPSGRVERFINLTTAEDHDRRVDKVLANESKLVKWQGDWAEPSLDNIKQAAGDLSTAEENLRKKRQEDPHSPEIPALEDAVREARNSLNAVALDPVSVAEQNLADIRKNNPPNSQEVKDAEQAVRDALAAIDTSDGVALTAASFTGSGKENAKEGLFALRKADLFNILCIPPHSSTEDIEASLIAEAALYCERRRAMMLVDPPMTWQDKDAAKAGVIDIGTNSKNAALFFPRLTMPNPLRDNTFENFVPCGAVAGIFARTDTQRGVWKAPAGLEATLVGVPALSVPLTDAENGELNPLGINCLRTLPPVGRVVWGSRTLQGDDRLASEWKYIPVRRTALFIEESLYRGTQWVVFEPNDEPLWAQIRLNVGAFMNNLFRQGAFQGTTPREAYFVKCDKETTTQNDINLGIVNIVVGFAPLKPAEFVIIKLQQMAGQIAV